MTTPSMIELLRRYGASDDQIVPLLDVIETMTLNAVSFPVVTDTTFMICLRVMVDTLRDTAQRREVQLAIKAGRIAQC